MRWRISSTLSPRPSAISATRVSISEPMIDSDTSRWASV